MPDPHRPQLEFTDCENCHKRVATTAPMCRHCNTPRTPVRSLKEAPSKSIQENDESDEDRIDQGTDHFALGSGGYGYDDDVEADEVNGKSGGMARLWWCVAVVLLLAILASTFIPLLSAP